jgi:hypothetical protein
MSSIDLNEQLFDSQTPNLPKPAGMIKKNRPSHHIHLDSNISNIVLNDSSFLPQVEHLKIVTA